MTEKRKLGVFLCHCGGNISDVVDVRAVREFAERQEEVVLATDTRFMCSNEGVCRVQDEIRKRSLDGVVVACCTPKMYEDLFRQKAEEAGMNPYLLEIANIREQCSTAEIINIKLNYPISFESGLTEINMGSLAGKAWTEMEAGMDLKQKHRTIQFDYRQQGGELAADVKQRVIEFLKKINHKHNDYEALLITHGGIIRVLHLLEYGQELTEEIEHISLSTFNLDKMLE